MNINPIKLYKYQKVHKTIKNSGLFDSKYYLFTYPDVRTQDIDPIKHYILHGAKEGRNPSVDFDTNYYLSTYKDIDVNKINPLFHYIVFGWKENRNPSSLFDTKFYLDTYKDVKKSGMNPLLHFVKYGQKENRLPNQRLKKINKIEIKSYDKKISIIIPVYNALDDVKKCINSIYEKKTLPFELIIMDDCSDGETKLYLEQESMVKGFKLYRNKDNLRFTKNVNKGIGHATGDIVTILNSDTIVTEKWLEKIIDCFESDDNIGIVGALSNAASWQSVPLQRDNLTGDWAVNELPINYTIDNMAKLVEVLSKKEYPKVPSVNGFCFSIKKEVINKVGVLDEETFPSGYGEEDDFCIRTKDAGYDIAIADNLYIYHSKSKSYSHELRKKFTKNNQGALEKKHGKKKKDLLIKNWKEESFIEIFSKRLKGYMKISNGNKIVVYTAIFGDYDKIKEPSYIHNDVDYVCYTDNPKLKSDVFEIRLVDRVYENMTKNPRMIKILSHLFLIGYDYSLWIDGSTKIRGLDFKELISEYLKDKSIALHSHIKRTCIYEEAKACIGLKKDNLDIINKQMEYYRKNNYPKDNGLVETAQILRKFNEDVKIFNESWWFYLDNFSVRDQLSFNYVSWLKKIPYSIFKGNQWNDQYFKIFPHFYDFNENLITTKKVSLVMLVRNSLDMTKISINSILTKTNYKNYELIIVDNDSDIVTKNYLLQLSDLHANIKIITNPQNESFSKANNDAVRESKGEYILFINNDIEAIEENWLSILIHNIETDDSIAAVGPILLYPDYMIQSASVNIEVDNGNLIKASENKKYFYSTFVNVITGACMLIKKDVFNDIGGFDEMYFYGQEDIDLCFKILENGKRIKLVAECELIYHESHTRKVSPSTHENRKKIRDKWKGKLIKVNDKPYSLKIK